ncbi:thioredoxin family protein [Spirosoma validum]|uniref:DUF255 domain-containing protein n=1 Tax=Spirosoma validum TaxID=2771355 RepID=A0A927B8G1_9BACT|nr:DUF255 domain-containing protein [Spirosoma validum]MBD2757656.1 DUF255 domain-containing protein [Spirosoma validum]
MKTRAHGFYLFIELWIIVCTVARADEPSGIKFFTGSWKDVLAEAKRQNKPVFVDIYTTWCGPCKRMAREAFPDAKVGEKFNAHFVSYQIDAEKGEGKDIAKKYAVAAYPTSLYVSSDGSLIQRTIGYGGISGMLEQADKAIEAAKDPNPLSAMEKQYEQGKRESRFMKAYLQKRTAVGMPNGEALTVYLKDLPRAEWSSDETITLIAGNATTYSPDVMDILLQKLTALKSATGETPALLRDKLTESIYRLNQIHFKDAVAKKNKQILADVIDTEKAYRQAGSEIALTQNQTDEIATNYQIDFYQQTKDWVNYGALATVRAGKLMKLSAADMDRLNEEAYQHFEAETRALPDSVKQSDNFKQYAAGMKKAEPKQTAMKLNNLAWSYYENMTDKKDLTQALAWSAKSLEYDRTGMHLDTYAHLLSKLGRKAEAIKTQQEAIATEKAAGGDVANYESELNIMKQK